MEVKEKNIKPQKGSGTIQIIGERFGKLIVNRFSHINKKRCRVWECKCDCGNSKYATTTSLRKKKVSSCGCISKKGDGFHKYNGYEEITGTKWNSIRQGAISRKLSFEITKKMVWDIYENQNRRCALSGIEISFKDKTASVDRKNNNSGYTSNNIWIVHRDVNLMRNKLTIPKFKFFCKMIASNKTKKTTVMVSDKNEEFLRKVIKPISIINNKPHSNKEHLINNVIEWISQLLIGLDEEIIMKTIKIRKRI